MLALAVVRGARDRALTAGERALLRPMITSPTTTPRARSTRAWPAPLYRIARAAGMRHFSIGGNWADALLTAYDQARLFLRIDRLTPRRHRSYFRGLLASIVPSQRWGIAPVAGERGFHIMFKGGWRIGIFHQVALLERGGKRIALAILDRAAPITGTGARRSRASRPACWRGYRGGTRETRAVVEHDDAAVRQPVGGAAGPLSTAALARISASSAVGATAVAWTTPVNAGGRSPGRAGGARAAAPSSQLRRPMPLVATPASVERRTCGGRGRRTGSRRRPARAAAADPRSPAQSTAKLAAAERLGDGVGEQPLGQPPPSSARPGGRRTCAPRSRRSMRGGRLAAGRAAGGRDERGRQVERRPRGRHGTRPPRPRRAASRRPARR